MPLHAQRLTDLQKKKRPSLRSRPRESLKMLDLTSMSASTTSISQRNRQDSPLLALPSEILKQILTEVVANEVVHVLPANHTTFNTRLCSSPENFPSPDLPRALIERDNNPFSDDDEYENCFTARHSCCSEGGYAVNAKQGLNLDVLRVCRQIYQEGSLLPFQENQFVFGLDVRLHGCRPTIDRFLNRMCLEQREAVRHVAVISNECLPRDKISLARLKDLRSLHIMVSVDDDTFYLYERIADTWKFASACKASWSSLSEFRINVEAFLDSWDYKTISKQVPELDRMLRHMEARTLRWNSTSAKAKTALTTAEDVKFQEDRFALVRRLDDLDRELDS